MKKIILSCAALAFAAATLVSCGENKEATTDSAATTAPAEGEKPAETTPPAPTTAAADVPTFSNEEVNKSLAEFKTLMTDYSAAVAAKDNAKIQEFGTKYQAWAQTAGTLASKLKPEEAQKYGEYMTKLAQEWAATAQNAMAK